MNQRRVGSGTVRAARRISLCVAILLIASVGNAEVVLDYSPDSVSYTSLYNEGPKAVFISATSSFNQFSLIQLPLFLGANAYAEDAGDFAVDLYSSTTNDPGTALPGSLLTNIASVPLFTLNGSTIGNNWTASNVGVGERSPGAYWIVVSTSTVTANSGALNWTMAGSAGTFGAYYNVAGQPWAQMQPAAAGYAEVVSGVPEPSTYAMALAGLGCAGYSVFRRPKRA